MTCYHILRALGSAGDAIAKLEVELELPVCVANLEALTRTKAMASDAWAPCAIAQKTTTELVQALMRESKQAEVAMDWHGHTHRP